MISNLILNVYDRMTFKLKYSEPMTEYTIKTSIVHDDASYLYLKKSPEGINLGDIVTVISTKFISLNNKYNFSNVETGNQSLIYTGIVMAIDNNHILRCCIINNMFNMGLKFNNISSIRDVINMLTKLNSTEYRLPPLTIQNHISDSFPISIGKPDETTTKFSMKDIFKRLFTGYDIITTFRLAGKRLEISFDRAPSNDRNIIANNTTATANWTFIKEISRRSNYNKVTIYDKTNGQTLKSFWATSSAPSDSNEFPFIDYFDAAHVTTPVVEKFVEYSFPSEQQVAESGKTLAQYIYADFRKIALNELSEYMPISEASVDINFEHQYLYDFNKFQIGRYWYLKYNDDMMLLPFCGMTITNKSKLTTLYFGKSTHTVESAFKTII